MANVKSQLTLEDKMSSTLSSITKAMHSTLTAMRSVKGVKLGPEFAKAASDIKLAENNINSLTKQVNQMSNSMNRGTSSTGSFLKGLIGFDLIKGAFNTITSQLDSAINRFDTINNYSNVMSSLGFGAEESQASIERLKEGLDGIPTTLDSAVTSVQRFASANENIGASTEMYLALNDAILAGGAQLPAQQAALEQVTQAYSKGKFEANEWKTMLIAMPAQLKQVAKEMGYTSTAVGGDFYNALQKGKISMNDMMKTMTELDSKTGGFHDQALKATNGIQTAIANAKTAITKGLVDMIDNANKALESAGLPTIQQIITNTGKTIQNALQNVGKVLGVVIGYAARVYNFFANNWSAISPIIYGIVAALVAYKAISLAVSVVSGIMAVAEGIKGAAMMLASGATIGATAAQWGLNSALLACPITWIILLIVALVAALIYLWNTNDGVANALITAWDYVKLGMMVAALGIKTSWYMLQTGIQTICAGILMIVQSMVNGIISLVNTLISALNTIPGVSINAINQASFGTKAMDKALSDAGARAAELGQDATAIANAKKELDSTRANRVQNRKKLSMDSFFGKGAKAGKSGAGLNKVDWNNLNNAVGNSNSGKGSGGKAVKTTSTDKNLLSDEDIKLLLDVATRDYKLNYQQVTPNVTVTFGDVRETADVDLVMDRVADKLEEIYDGNLEV